MLISGFKKENSTLIVKLYSDKKKLTHSPSVQVPPLAILSGRQNASYLQHAAVDVWAIGHVLPVYVQRVYQQYVGYKRHTHLVMRIVHESVMVNVEIVHSVHSAPRLTNSQFHLSVEHDSEEQVRPLRHLLSW